ncbi:MAG: hypothetical protein WC551_10425 [Patescibacteria group bacterium]
MNNREVAHRWAQGNGGEAKGSHFYYEGDKIYSYGSHYLLGHLVRGLALINSRGYSVTTAKHTSYALYALHGHPYRVIDVQHPEAATLEDHAANLEEIKARYLEAAVKSTRARLHVNEYLRNMETAKGDYIAYKKAFKITGGALPSASTPEERARILAKAKQAEAAERAAQKARVEAKKKEEADALEAWRRGENKGNYFYASDIALRLSADGKYIETSRDARVPLSLGQGLYRQWQKCTGDIVGRTIGSYTVNSADAAGIKIGCHTIKAEEVHRFFAGVDNQK